MKLFFRFSEQKQEENYFASIYNLRSLNGAMGYKLLSNKNFCLSPMVGASYYNFKIKVFSAVTNQSIVSYLAQAGNQSEISSQQYFVYLGTRFDFLIDRKGGQEKKFFIGFRGGYSLPITKVSWMMNTTKLSAGPDINTGGILMELVLGFF